MELFLFDTGAQRLYKERAGRYWDAVSLGIICYDCSSRASFEAVPRWCQALRELRKSAQVPVALVATKGDMQGAGCVPSEEGAELARSLGLQFFETSAAPPGPVVAARLGSTAFHDSAAPGTPLTGATTAATVAIGADVPAASKRTVTGALELVYPHTADR